MSSKVPQNRTAIDHIAKHTALEFILLRKHTSFQEDSRYVNRSQKKKLTIQMILMRDNPTEGLKLKMPNPNGLRYTISRKQLHKYFEVTKGNTAYYEEILKQPKLIEDAIREAIFIPTVPLSSKLEALSHIEYPMDIMFPRSTTLVLPEDVIEFISNTGRSFVVDLHLMWYNREYLIKMHAKYGVGKCSEIIYESRNIMDELPELSHCFPNLISTDIDSNFVVGFYNITSRKTREKYMHITPNKCHSTIHELCLGYVMGIDDVRDRARAALAMIPYFVEQSKNDQSTGL